MSDKDLAAFADALRKDTDLTAELERRVLDAGDRAPHRVVAAFAREKGFDVTDAETEEVHRRATAAPAGGKDAGDRLSGTNWFWRLRDFI